MKAASVGSLRQWCGLGGLAGAAAVGMAFGCRKAETSLSDVNEEGTEAAAATAVHAYSKSMSRHVRVDHPFIFLIRENRTGSILFLGRIVDPCR